MKNTKNTKKVIFMISVAAPNSACTMTLSPGSRFTNFRGLSARSARKEPKLGRDLSSTVMTEKMEIATTKQSRMFQPSAKYASFAPYNPKENIFRSISAENIAVIQISIEYKMNDE
jgi:hypothetical protein